MADCSHHDLLLQLRVSYRAKTFELSARRDSTLREIGTQLQSLTGAAPQTIRLLIPHARRSAPSSFLPFSEEHADIRLEQSGVAEGRVIRMMGALPGELEEVLRESGQRSEGRILGFMEEEKRAKQRLALGSRSGTKLPGGSYIFCDFRTLQLPGIVLDPPTEKALQIMHKLASDPGIVSIMNKHRWRVGLMTEMAPVGYVGISPKCILGYNKNFGEEISLRLRTDDLKGFRKYDSIKKTLLHELAHMVHSEHDADFYTLNKQLNEEAISLDWTKSKGHTWSGLKYYEEEGPVDAGVVLVDKSTSGYTLGGHMEHELSARSAAAAAALHRFANSSISVQAGSDTSTEFNSIAEGHNGSSEPDPEKKLGSNAKNVEPDPDDCKERIKERVDEPDPDESFCLGLYSDKMLKPWVCHNLGDTLIGEADLCLKEKVTDQKSQEDLTEQEPDPDEVNDDMGAIVEPDPDDEDSKCKELDPNDRDIERSYIKDVCKNQLMRAVIGDAGIHLKKKLPGKISQQELREQEPDPDEMNDDMRAIVEPDPDDVDAKREEPDPDDVDTERSSAKDICKDQTVGVECDPDDSEGLGTIVAEPDPDDSTMQDEPDPDDPDEVMFENSDLRESLHAHDVDGKQSTEVMNLAAIGVTNGRQTVNGDQIITELRTEETQSNVPSFNSEDLGLKEIQESTKMISGRLQQAITKLKEEATPSESVMAIQTLFTILRNVMEHPHEAKYKRLRKGNPAFQSRVAKFKGALEVLYAVGFLERACDEIGESECLVLSRNDPGLLWLARASLETCIA